MPDAETCWIKNPLAIYTANTLDAGGGVVTQGSQIVEVVATGMQPKIPITTVFDASEHVVLPGLINAHHHFYQTLTRAFFPALNKPLFPWLTSLYPVWAHLTPLQLELATELALTELLLSGCTTSADHHYIFTHALESAIDIQVEAARKMKMRVQLTRGSMSLGQDEGGLPPPATVQGEDDILLDSQRVIQAFHDKADGALVKISLAPCSPFSVSESLMRASASLAREYDVALHTHLAETEDENRFCLQTYQLRPVDFLEKVGWLNSDVWLAHGIFFEPNEIQRLGQAGVGVCHCPSSNMVLSSGICRGRELERAGVGVGLGVDGSASNDGSNMINEVRQALLIQRLRYSPEKMTHLDALRWATQGSAACLKREDIGELAPGKQADIACFTLDELRFSGVGDPLAALVMCGAQRADRVMVAGIWRVIEGQPVDVDLEALMARHRAAARQLQGSI
ncbi:MAG TPA: 8-oxoguanine deaminase [Gammaproteobacteria bacterium]|nr:8-oxoguanine deaminase [Gammaproteobacteria bacterium]HCO60429.1 8-oxoguanine deaminase [Porticoccaceae bacterium]